MGDASVVVVLSMVEPSDVAGVIVSMGVDSAGVVMTVVPHLPSVAASVPGYRRDLAKRPGMTF